MEDGQEIPKSINLIDYLRTTADGVMNSYSGNEHASGSCSVPGRSASASGNSSGGAPEARKRSSESSIKSPSKLTSFLSGRTAKAESEHSVKKEDMTGEETAEKVTSDKETGPGGKGIPVTPDVIAQDVLSRLRFIARIQPGERIDVESLCIYAVSWQNSIRRWWKEEGRELSLTFVRRAVHDALTIIEEFLGRPDDCLFIQVGEIVLCALKDARAGLCAFARTYELDRMFVSRVGTLRDMVSLRVAAIEAIHFGTASTS